MLPMCGNKFVIKKIRFSEGKFSHRKVYPCELILKFFLNFVLFMPYMYELYSINAGIDKYTDHKQYIVNVMS